MDNQPVKNPFEFWNYRDVRSEKFPVPKIISVPVESSNVQKHITILLSHHYLVPLEQTPKVILDFLRSSLTIENPEFKDYQKYGKGFIPKHIQPFIKMYVADSTYLGLPRSINFQILEQTFKKQNITIEIKDIRPKFETIDLVRKDFEPIFYQKEAIDQIVNSNVILKLFCGRGKTALTLLAIDQIRLPTLILVRTNLLIKQWVEEIHNVFDISDRDIGVINADQKTEGKITVATVQSLLTYSREDKKRIAQKFGHIVCDEAHEAAAQQYFKLLKIFECQKITGLTATPMRPDGKSKIIASYIGKIIKVDDSGIIPIKFRIVKTEFEYKHDGRKNEYVKMIDALVSDEARNNKVLNQIEEFAKLGKVIFVYSARIKHLETLQEALRQRCPDIKTGMIVNQNSSGKKITIEEQEAVRQSANQEETKVIFGTQIIKQGFNVRPLSVVIVATPAKSTILIEQLMGREQREYKDKDEVIYVDFIDEKIKTLLYQFFYKNKNIYKAFKEKSYDSRKAMEVKRAEVL